MELSQFYYWLALCLVITGLTRAVTMLPNNLNGAVGGSVTFTTTQSPSETPYYVVSWSFEANGEIKSIITSSSDDYAGAGYAGRVTLHRSTGSLELRNLTLSDVGEYILSITPTAGTQVTGKCNLHVYQPVSSVALSSGSSVLVESSNSVRLSCSSSGSSPSFLWMNGSSEVAAGDRVLFGDGGAALTIVNVTRYDLGPYTCNVSNPISGGVSGPLVLGISFGPEKMNLEIFPSEEHHREGSNVTLSCSAVSRPPAAFDWFFNGTQLTDTGPELVLELVQMSQSGNYSCRAFNKETLRYEASRLIAVTVLEIASASIAPSSRRAVEGSPFNLTCRAGVPVTSRRWAKGGRPLTPGGDITLHGDGRVASFAAVMRTDAGEYSCDVSNPVSSDRATYRLVVNYGPGNIQVTGPVEIEVEQTLKLTCSVESIPSANYTWTLNGTEILGRSAVLIKTANFSDSGRFTCHAENNVTGKSISATHGVSVKEQGSLEKPLFAGAIVAIALASLILVFAIGSATYFMFKRARNSKALKASVKSKGHTSNNKAIADNSVPGDQEPSYADVRLSKVKGAGAMRGHDAPYTIYTQVFE